MVFHILVFWSKSVLSLWMLDDANIRGIDEA